MHGADRYMSTSNFHTCPSRDRPGEAVAAEQEGKAAGSDTQAAGMAREEVVAADHNMEDLTEGATTGERGP